jgi:hypothetical protein
VQQPPAGVGAVAFTPASDAITARFVGSTLSANQHSIAILLVDALTGRPAAIDHGFETTQTAAPDGTIQTVRLALDPGRFSGTFRAYLMVDAYPAFRDSVVLF